MKAMSLRPAERYQSVEELQREITAYQSGFATAAEEAGTWRLLALALKRHRREFTLAAVAMVVIFALTIAFLVKVTIERGRALVGENKATQALNALRDTAPMFHAQAIALRDEGHFDDR